MPRPARRHDGRAGGDQASEAGERGAAAGERDLGGGLGFLRGRTRPATPAILAFIEQHKDRTDGGLRWGVESICAVLTQHDVKIEDDGPNPHQLMWHRINGHPLTNGDTNELFRKALRMAGIKRDATTHWLRHTYTTMAEHAGIPWVVYSRISGHASEDVSRGYTHQLETESRAGIDQLESFLRRRG